MPSCKTVKNRLSLYLDGVLKEKESENIKKHLSECESCRSEYQALKELIEQMDFMEDVLVPPGFHESVMDKIHQVQPEKEKIAYLPMMKAAFGTFGVFIILSISASYIRLGILNSSGNELSPMTDQVLFDSPLVKMQSEIQEESMGRLAGNVDDDDLGEFPAPFYTGELIEAESEDSLMAESYNYEPPIEDTGNYSLRSSNINKEDYNGVVKQYHLHIEVDDVQKYREMIESMGGDNHSVHISDDTANIVKRVPTEEYEALKLQLRNLGASIIEESEYETNYFDSNRKQSSKMNAREEELNRLINLMAHAETVEEMILIENRIWEVEQNRFNHKNMLASNLSAAEQPYVYINITSEGQGIESFVFSQSIINSFMKSVRFTVNFMENILVLFSSFMIPGVFIIVCCFFVKYLYSNFMKSRR